jgi:poly-D-alanine transfer protein DltD
VRPEVRAILNEICSLSRKYGFSIHIIWPPVQIKLHQALLANGSLQKIDAQISGIFKENGVPVTIDDSDSKHDYPYFDRDLVHIKGQGWEQLYANELTAYIHGFERHPP